MAKRSLVRTQPSKLLKTLLDNPELPTFVAHLETPTLNKLIEYVGPEDAGALIAYTTNRQLRSILDESLWASLAPGSPVTHRPEEFIRWLYILQDQGEEFLAERLLGLGLDYLVLNFAQLVTVNNPQAILSFDYDVLEQYAGAGAYAEEFEGFYVTAVHDEEWDVTRSALAALQAEQPQFLEHLLYRMGRDEASLLMHDIAGELRDSKERAGYVTPESATAFLKLTRQTSLASLVVGANHDPVSARYFSELGKSSAEDDATSASQDAAADAAAEESSSAPQPDAEKQQELEELLVQAEIVTTEQSALLLPAPEHEDVLPVKSALDSLQHVDPQLFSERVSELVYLSNVLIAGTILDGKRFDETQAAHAVLATCNIGMSYLGEDTGDAQSIGEGLVRLFRIGWQVLQQIPTHVTKQLVTILRSTEVTKQFFDRKWILSEIDTTLDELLEHVENEQFSEAKTSLVFISLVLEEEICDALQLMISDYPRYPLDSETRFVESMEDIPSIDKFLKSLPEHAKS